MEEHKSFSDFEDNSIIELGLVVPTKKDSLL